MRISLCEDDQAKDFMEQMRNAAKMLGMNPADVNARFYESLKADVQKMMDQLDTP